jgi:hypothetical protein
MPNSGGEISLKPEGLRPFFKMWNLSLPSFYSLFSLYVFTFIIFFDFANQKATGIEVKSIKYIF